MRHRVDGRAFGRNTSHRLAMFRNMANSAILSEQIVTTTPKAKEVRRVVDRLITLGKKGGLHNRRRLFDLTRNKAVVKKVFDELAKRYSSRPGGYTRVLKMSDLRRGDGAEKAVLELVDRPELKRTKAQLTSGKTKKAAAEGDVATPSTTDPFNKFRKLFGGKKTRAAGPAASSGTPEVAKTEKKAPKKAPAKTSAPRKSSSRAKG